MLGSAKHFQRCSYGCFLSFLKAFLTSDTSVPLLMQKQNILAYRPLLGKDLETNKKTTAVAI
jgi:hypothetical protein